MIWTLSEYRCEEGEAPPWRMSRPIRRAWALLEGERGLIRWYVWAASAFVEFERGYYEIE